MTSLPPHANEPAIGQFLDEEEAASLTEALLHLVETDPEPEEPQEVSDKLASESKIDKPPVLIHKLRKRNSPSFKQRKSKTAVVQPSSVSTSTTRDADIDVIHRDLRAAMETSNVVSANSEPEEVVKVSGTTHEDSVPVEPSEQTGVFFFDRSAADVLPVEDNFTNPQVELPVRISMAVRDFFGRKLSELKTVGDQHEVVQSENPTIGLPGPYGDRQGAEQGEAEQTSLATVAGSGFSEGAPSETIAGSGGPPVDEEDGSFSWICAERSAGRSRLGFDSSEPGEDLVTAQTTNSGNTADALYGGTSKRPGCSVRPSTNGPIPRRLGSPLLVSSDLAGIQTFRTRGMKAQDLRYRSSSNGGHHRGSGGVTSDPDRILATAIAALEPYKKDKVVAAMAAVAIISIGIFGWVAYAYISDWSDASANLRQSLLLGPLVLRSSALGQRSSFALGASRKRSLGSVPVEPDPVPDRPITTAQFVITPLGVDLTKATTSSYLVDLPRLETTMVPGRAPGAPSAVNTKNATQQPKHRDRRADITPRRSVINRRLNAGQGRTFQSQSDTVHTVEAVVAEAISRLEAGPRRVRN